MAQAAGVLTDTLLRRVRDTQGLAHSRAFTRSILTHAQRLVNAQQRLVLTEETLATVPRRLLYPIAALLPLSLRVEYVREDGRDIPPTTLTTLATTRPGWSRQVGDFFQAWAPVGRDLLVVWPSKTIASSVTVVSTKLTTDLATEGTLTEVPDEALPAVLDVAELLLLLKSRMWPAFSAAVSKVGLNLSAVAGSRT
jgi:hypothetical protein